MKTTRHNPGAFVASRPPALGQTMRRTARALRQRHWSDAYHQFVVGFVSFGEQQLARFRSPRFFCPCCGYTGYAFIHKANALRIAWHSACPGCNSRSRHRGLALLLPRLMATAMPLKVLHIAPEPVLRRVIEQQTQVVYLTTDMFLSDVDYPGENIEKLSFTAATYDFVICNHVLEHVAEDEQAMAEIARILVPAGRAVITIPGEWSRPQTIQFPDLSLNGHYRDYGLDVVPRFERYFERVELFHLSQLDRTPEGLSLGINPGDLAFICHTRAA